MGVGDAKVLKAKDWLKDIWSPSNLWGIFQWLFPAASAAVSAWLSVLKGLPPSVILLLALMTAACAVIIFDFAKNWFDRRDANLLKIAELEARLRPPASDMAISLDGQIYESFTDENNELLPSSLSFALRLINRGDKFLKNCQITFGLGHARYPVSNCFDLRRGEQICRPFLRTKDLPIDHRENRHALVYFLNNETWKIMADGPAWLAAPGLYEIEVLSADTAPASLLVKLSKGEDGWKLEEVAS
jgi:hypothetical protein